MFQRYKRCPWEIDGDIEGEGRNPPITYLRSMLTWIWFVQVTHNECAFTTGYGGRIHIIPVSSSDFLQFETSINFLSPQQPSPPSMHFDRTDEEEHLALPGATSREYMKPLVNVHGWLFD